MTRTIRFAVLAVASVGAPAGLAAQPDRATLAAEEARMAVIERVSRSTVAVFEPGAGNGGSGVIVSPDGLVVTNFHVVAPSGPRMLVGTSDGRVHEAVLLGLDPTGDIALARLLGDGPWPTAELGDSDSVRVGDPAIVVGNPFLLAEDFTPSVSVGVISGVHRYQHPSGGVLEYADCLQTDAAINPGNSGGPLFDAAGGLIGINGRGSFEKRGRVNVGVGYAVSINQVKRFLPALALGRVVDHGSLGATVVTRRGGAIVDAIETDSDAYRRGLRAGDELVSLDGRDTPTANALLNALGVLPSGWAVRVEYRRDGRLRRFDTRLAPLHAPGELEQAIAEATPPAPGERTPPPAEAYAAREGFANDAPQRQAVERLVAACRDSAAARAAETTYHDAVRDEAVTLRIGPDGASWRAASGRFHCDPASDLAAQAAPPAAPALLGALWVWRTLERGGTESLDQVEALGDLPWSPGGEPGPALAVTHRGLTVTAYFDPRTGEPLGLEASRDAAEDSLRVVFGPSERWMLSVWQGDRRVAGLTPRGSAGEATGGEP